MIAALLHDRRGGTAVLTALAFSTMLGFAALGIDAGRWLQLRQAMQGAADAAATAAAISDGDARDEALGMAAAHGLIDGADGVRITIGWRKARGGAIVDVVIERPAPAGMGQLLGLAPPLIAVRASAASAAGCAGKPGCSARLV